MNGFCVGCGAPPARSSVTATTAPARNARLRRMTIVPPPPGKVPPRLARASPRTPAPAGDPPRRARAAVLDNPGLVGLACRRRGEIGDDERAAAARDDDGALR